MGQYYVTVNLDKRQFLNPHSFGDGLKLVEFGSSGFGTMMGLAALLSSGNGRGGGDVHSSSPLIGSWAGDRIVVAGDYDDAGKFLTRDMIRAFIKAKRAQGEEYKDDEVPTLYQVAWELFVDISADVAEALGQDTSLADELVKSKVLKPDGLVRRCKKCHAAIPSWVDGSHCTACADSLRE